jgi:hypothetical protein
MNILCLNACIKTFISKYTYLYIYINIYPPEVLKKIHGVAVELR